MRHLPQRKFDAPLEVAGTRKLKDTDTAVRTYKLRALFHGLAGGVILGAGLGWKLGPLGGLLGLVVGWALAYFIAVGLMEGAGAAAQVVYAPSGKSTPARREYSEAQALHARGLYAEAVATYQTFVAEFPEDPEPYLRIARILRDDVREYADAARWFRTARRDARLTPGQDLLIAQELIELYRNRLGEPRRAIPELARIPQLVPGTPQAEAARRELAELRAQIEETPG